MRLNQAVVGMAADAQTGGYWLVASDGGIFAFGAPFFGSTGSIHLQQPVNGMAAAPDGDGYWFVASDGGIFAYGGARSRAAPAVFGSTLRSWAWPPTTPPGATGWSGPTAGSSASTLPFYGAD